MEEVGCNAYLNSGPFLPKGTLLSFKVTHSNLVHVASKRTRPSNTTPSHFCWRCAKCSDLSFSVESWLDRPPTISLEVADAWYFTWFISRSHVHVWGSISNTCYLCKLHPISKMPSVAMKSGTSSQIWHFLFSSLVYRRELSQAFQSCRYFTHVLLHVFVNSWGKGMSSEPCWEMLLTYWCTVFIWCDLSNIYISLSLLN